MKKTNKKLHPTPISQSHQTNHFYSTLKQKSSNISINHHPHPKPSLNQQKNKVKSKISIIKDCIQKGVPNVHPKFKRITPLIEIIKEEQPPSFSHISPAQQNLDLSEYGFAFTDQSFHQLLSNRDCPETKIMINNKCTPGTCLSSCSKSQTTSPGSSFPLLLKYLQIILNCFPNTKHLVSIYMEQGNKIHDMLSIRRQIKHSQAQLVKTHIPQTKKSKLILNKLIEFAEHRESINYRENVRGFIVIRVQVQFELGKDESKQNYGDDKKEHETVIELSQSRECLQFDPQTQKIQVYRILEGCCQNHLAQLKKPSQKQVPEYENEKNKKKLLEHLANLHSQLQQSKKQLQNYKQKAKDLQDLEDMGLASERINIQLDKYQSINIKPNRFAHN